MKFAQNNHPTRLFGHTRLFGTWEYLMSFHFKKRRGKADISFSKGNKNFGSWVIMLKASLLHYAGCLMPTAEQYDSGITQEAETASDSFHDVRGWKKIFKVLGNYVIKLL